MLPFLIIGSPCSFTAGLAQSTLIGMALIMAPCIMLVVEPIAMVPIILLMSTVNTFMVAVRNRHMINLRLLIPLPSAGLSVL